MDGVEFMHPQLQSVVAPSDNMFIDFDMTEGAACVTQTHFVAPVKIPVIGV
jgi:hypothetical protein